MEGKWRILASYKSSREWLESKGSKAVYVEGGGPRLRVQFSGLLLPQGVVIHSDKDENPDIQSY